jgi:branched-chain amino acid transport system substrate-binding protein
VIPTKGIFRSAGIALVVAMTAASAACTTVKSTAAGRAASGQDPITIGVLAGITGQGAVDAAEMHLNVDLAIAQTNASGGIAGHPLRAIYVDTGGDPQAAAGEASQLVDRQRASVLLGGALSAECTALAQEAEHLEVVYLTASGCPTAELTAQRCNAYTFRLMPAGLQVVEPLAKYAVDAFGQRWAIVYPDYAFGRSQLELFEAALAAAGANSPVAIPIPLGEQDPTPIIAKIPADGSINGVINLEGGADLTSVDDALRQSGLSGRMPVIFAGNKERFGGSYPNSVDGFIFATTHLSTPANDSGADKTFESAFSQQVLKEPQLAALLGGPGKSVAGQSGYQAYATMSALRQAMIKSGFTGRADTRKLIEALESVEARQSSDFPSGAVRMNAADHQGAAALTIARVTGQAEEPIQAVQPQDLPPIGSCRVS